MEEFAVDLVHSAVQCWGCELFDRLFLVVSTAAAAVYKQFTTICVILFCVAFAFFVFNAVYQNIKSNKMDAWYEKSIQHVVINGLVALALLSMGVVFPRFITTITFEPTADIALIYTESLLHTNNDAINERVTYQPMELPDDGFFRPKLRDTTVMLMKATITQLQSYIQLGIAIMDSAFTWQALLGPGAIIKHIILFIVGLCLAWGFFKFFVKFCFYFIDFIVAMAYFAFFFPLSLAMFPFSGAEYVPKWLSGIGKGMGTHQIKNVINAIISLSASIITYSVIMMIIATFFAGPDMSVTQLMEHIMDGTVFAADLSDDNLEAMTLMSIIVLVYVVNYIFDQIPQVSKMVMSVFDISENHKLGDQFANNAITLTKDMVNIVATPIKKIIQKDKTDGDDKSKPTESKGSAK